MREAIQADKEFAEKFMDAYWASGELEDAIALMRTTLRDETLERCAKRVCHWCRTGIESVPWEGRHSHFVSDGLQPKGHKGRWTACNARSILALKDK